MTKPPAAPVRKILARPLTWHRTPPSRGLAGLEVIDPWANPSQLSAAQDPPASSDPPAADPAASSDPPAADPPPRIDPTGGKYGAGIIRGVSVATRGEALGHGYWLDAQFIQETAAAINASPDGHKSRFTHPSLSADGLGTFLGRSMNATVTPDGRQVLADLHIDPTAHNTPKGNLAQYAMDLAKSDPKAFGASIVFKANDAAAADFQKANSRQALDDRGRPVRVFFSPDPENLNNLPHVRLAELRAVDIVDTPAANPNGMFSADPLLDNLDALAAYAVGLTDQPPAENALDADADRLREYLGRFLSAHGLAIVARPEAGEDETDQEPPREALADSLARFRQRFGPQLAAELLIDRGLSWPEALDAYAAGLETQLAAAKTAADQQLAAATAAAKQEADQQLAALAKQRDELADKLAKAEAALAALPKGLAKPLSQHDPAADSTPPPAARLNGLTPAAARYALALTIPAPRK